jgi:hypothetical protein
LQRSGGGNRLYARRHRAVGDQQPNRADETTVAIQNETRVALEDRSTTDTLLEANHTQATSAAYTLANLIELGNLRVIQAIYYLVGVQKVTYDGRTRPTWRRTRQGAVPITHHFS